MMRNLELAAIRLVLGGTMREEPAALLVLAFIACGGGSPTGSGNGSGVVSSLDVVEGNGKSAPVQQPMPDSVVGEVRDDNGDPVEDVTVNFDVPAGDSAGTFEANVLQTNADGRVVNQLTAGVKAWTSRVVAGEDSAYTARLVASIEGRPDEVAEITFAVQPGPVGDFTPTPSEIEEGSDQDRENGLLDFPMSLVMDSLSNPVPFRVEPRAFGHAEGTRSVAADSSGCAIADVMVSDTSVAEIVVVMNGDLLHPVEDGVRDRSRVILQERDRSEAETRPEAFSHDRDRIHHPCTREMVTPGDTVPLHNHG